MSIICRNMGASDYQSTLAAMQTFTKTRSSETSDELWLTEHASVYTLGLNHTNERLPVGGGIPIVQTDRGGKITYHGRGQVIIYVLLDLNRHKLKVHELVSLIENGIIKLLSMYGVIAVTKKDAPGVYIGHKKIASLGLRLKNNCCYHGLSLNVDMDLTPFAAIDPCGYQGLQMTQTKDVGIAQTPQLMGEALLKILQEKLNE